MTPRVIDLSHHNVIPASLVPTAKAGVWGLIHKATEGTSFKDSKLKARSVLAREAGLLFGVYHFIRPGSISQQASFFCKYAGEYADALTLYALDWEDDAVSGEDALEFMQAVEAETGHKPVLYSGHVLKEACQSGAPNELANYRLWLAQYASACELPVGFEDWWLWQYTDQGEIDGVTPPTDLNAYEGTRQTLLEEWPGTPFETVVEPEKDRKVSISITADPRVEFELNINGEKVKHGRR
jgi:lysozyme